MKCEWHNHFIRKWLRTISLMFSQGINSDKVINPYLVSSRNTSITLPNFEMAGASYGVRCASQNFGFSNAYTRNSYEDTVFTKITLWNWSVSFDELCKLLCFICSMCKITVILTVHGHILIKGPWSVSIKLLGSWCVIIPYIIVFLNINLPEWII